MMVVVVIATVLLVAKSFSARPIKKRKREIWMNAGMHSTNMGMWLLDNPWNRNCRIRERSKEPLSRWKTCR